MAEHKKKDEAPAYPAPPMTDADVKASAKHAADEAAKSAPKAKDAEPPKAPNASGHFSAPTPKKD